MAEAGVDRIEAGFAASSEEDRTAVASIVKEVNDAEIWGFGRCTSERCKNNCRNRGKAYSVGNIHKPSIK